jgi:peptide/nickel transport system permease protein
VRNYITKRFVLFIPTLLIVTVVVFSILRVIPGDPALLILGGESGDDEFTEAQLQALRHKLGTDRNILVRYISWVGNMLKGDCGASYFYEGEPVIDDLTPRWFLPGWWAYGKLG